MRMQRVGDCDLPVGGIDAAARKHKFARHEFLGVMAAPHQHLRFRTLMVEDDQRRGVAWPYIWVLFTAGVFPLDRFGVVGPLDDLWFSGPVAHVPSTNFVSAGVPPKPCMRKAHCQPISAPLTRGSSASDMTIARVSPAAIGIHIGAS